MRSTARYLNLQKTKTAPNSSLLEVTVNAVTSALASERVIVANLVTDMNGSVIKLVNDGWTADTIKAHYCDLFHIRKSKRAATFTRVCYYSAPWLTLSLEGYMFRFVLHALAKAFYEYYVRDVARYCVCFRLPGSSPL